MEDTRNTSALLKILVNTGKYWEGGVNDLLKRTLIERIAALFCFCIVISTSVIGNIAVIYAVWNTRSLKEQLSSLFIVNLSISDLMTALVIMTSSAVSVFTDTGHIPWFYCNVICAVNYCLIVVSMITLAFIAIDRYLTIRYTFNYEEMMTEQRAKIMVAWTWIQGLIIASIPVTLDWIRYDYWEMTCAIGWQRYKGTEIYVVAACISCFLVPGCTILYCYWHVIKQANKCGRNHAERQQKRQISRTIKSLIVVVILFFIFMTPFCVTKFLKVVLSNPDMIPAHLNSVASFFTFFSSVCNPFVYAIFRADFRMAFGNMLTRIPAFAHDNGTMSNCVRTMFPPCGSYSNNSSDTNSSVIKPISISINVPLRDTRSPDVELEGMGRLQRSMNTVRGKIRFIRGCKIANRVTVI